MPRLESRLRPLSPAQQALVDRIRAALATGTVGQRVELPPEVVRALDDMALEAARPGLEAIRRLEWLHGPAKVDGYEWGIFRVKWSADGRRADQVWRTCSDHSDLDAAMQVGCEFCRHPLFLGSSCSNCGAVFRGLDDEDPHVMSALDAGVLGNDADQPKGGK